jgi:hypothetical protein
VSQRPAPLRSALPRGPEAVIKPETTTTPTTSKTGKAGNSGKAGYSGNAGNTGNAVKSGALYKLTARVDQTFIGQCQAAYLHALLTDPNAAPTFEAWVIGALEDKLKRAEKKNGAPFVPIAALPRGRKPRA